jgi:hypothetical protein
MAAPVIIRTQSVLEYLQHQSWEFQAYATNSPTFWNVSPLPSGIGFNPATGRIAGAATKPGVTELGLLAGNADGISPIEATTALPPIDAVDLIVDLGTGEVSANPAAVRKLKRGQGDAAVDVTPLFWMKRGDIRFLHVALASLKLALKAIEPENVLVTSSGFIRCDTGANTFYRMAVTVTGDSLSGELGNNETDFTAEIPAIAELEWKWANELVPTFGPAQMISSSLNFDVGVARDLQ